MWKILQDTPKRLPTWVGGTSLSPYDASLTTETISLNSYEAQASYLTTMNFVQKSKLPFLAGFLVTNLGVDGYNNSASRRPTVDLNACYYLTIGDFPTSKQAELEFYFTDLNSYRDLDWVNYYANEAAIYKDREPTQYKVADLKGLSITDRTTIRVRISFDLFYPFLGFSPFIRKKKLLKIVGVAPNSNTVSYYGQVYRFDKYLDFPKNTFFKLNGDVCLCP